MTKQELYDKLNQYLNYDPTDPESHPVINDENIIDLTYVNPMPFSGLTSDDSLPSNWNAYSIEYKFTDNYTETLSLLDNNDPINFSQAGGVEVYDLSTGEWVMIIPAKDPQGSIVFPEDCVVVFSAGSATISLRVFVFVIENNVVAYFAKANPHESILLDYILSDREFAGLETSLEDIATMQVKLILNTDDLNIVNVTFQDEQGQSIGVEPRTGYAGTTINLPIPGEDFEIPEEKVFDTWRIFDGDTEITPEYKPGIDDYFLINGTFININDINEGYVETSRDIVMRAVFIPKQA